MKKYVQFLTFLLLSFFLTKSYAQQSLIYYWHFNNLVNFTTSAASPSTFPVIRPNYTTLDSTKAFIKFAALSGTSGNASTYYDYVSPGDALNVRFGTSAGYGLRPRNPTDSMQLMLYIPSTSYKNITIKYETQKSSASNGAASDSLDYSVDSGSTWKTSGMTPLISSNSTTWSSTVNYATITDASAFNTNKLVFRIRFNAPGNTGSSGNVRFDNFTVEGDTIIPPKLIYYWHFNNLINFTTSAASPSTFPVIRPNYTTLDSTKSFIKYAPLSGTTGNVATYYDYVSPGDTVNARFGTVAGYGLRPRNPSDSMQLMVYIPSTGYKNIIIKYETQKSSASNGAASDSMDYSLDSGSTWKNSEITPLVASNTTTWSAAGSPITATISDLQSWNNSKLIFRIRFNGAGNTGSSGNVRMDNLTIEGDTFIGTYPLPVKLLSFNAHLVNENEVILNWQTASEINNDHFEIESSVDKSKWLAIANLKGAGISNSTLNYQYQDYIENPAPVIYYRLKQVDFNGVSNFSNIIAVTFKNSLPNLITIENPIKDNNCKVSITSANQSTVNLFFRNLFGEIVLNYSSKIEQVNTQLNIDMGNLSNGIYFVEIKSDNTTLAVEKIVK